MGSGSTLVHALSSYMRLGQQAGAKQFDARSSVHLPLERFKTVNVSLDWSVAPRFSYCCFDCTQVLLQTPYKARQRMNTSFLRALHPQAQGSQLADTQEGTKVQNQFPHHREAGTLLFESIHNFCLFRSQFCTEFAQQNSATDTCGETCLGAGAVGVFSSGAASGMATIRSRMGHSFVSDGR